MSALEYETYLFVAGFIAGAAVVWLALFMQFTHYKKAKRYYKAKQRDLDAKLLEIQSQSQGVPFQ